MNAKLVEFLIRWSMLLNIMLSAINKTKEASCLSRVINWSTHVWFQASLTSMGPWKWRTNHFFYKLTYCIRKIGLGSFITLFSCESQGINICNLPINCCPINEVLYIRGLALDGIHLGIFKVEAEAC